MGGRMTLDGVKLGGDAFTIIRPPLDPGKVVLRQSDLGPRELLKF